LSALDVAAKLKPPEVLERMSLAIAALDVVMSSDRSMRYFNFDPTWSASERMASMRDGSGNSYAIIFGPLGCVVRGFDHESTLSPWGLANGSIAEGLLDGFPDQLRSVIDDPEFRTPGGPTTDLTFCAWRLADDNDWAAGSIEDVDGSAEWLFEVLLDGTPDGYLRFAADYYEQQLPRDSVAAFYNLNPADSALILAIAPDSDIVAVLADLHPLGYPVCACQAEADQP